MGGGNSLVAHQQRVPQWCTLRPGEEALPNDLTMTKPRRAPALNSALGAIQQLIGTMCGLATILHLGTLPNNS